MDFDKSPSELTSLREQPYIKVGEHLRISWIPNEVFPPEIVETDEPINVHIELYFLKAENQWEQFLSSTAIKNTGNHTLEIKPERRIECPGLTQLSEMLCPMVIKVSAEEGSAPILSSSSTIPSTVGIWSGVAFIASNDVDEGDMSLACHCWADKCSDPSCSGYQLCSGVSSNNNKIPPLYVSGLPPCPPTEEQAKFDSSFMVESKSSLISAMESKYSRIVMSFYHQGMSKCYIQRRDTIR